MVVNGERERETIRPEFDRSIMIDFQGAKRGTLRDGKKQLFREPENGLTCVCSRGISH